MELLEALRMSWRTIRGHRLRSTLTTLGVVIGVAAVISLVTLGGSLQTEVLGEVGGGQAQNIRVWVGPEGQTSPGFGAQPVFTEHDVRGLQGVRGVRGVVPWGGVAMSSVEYRGHTIATNAVIATTPRYFGSTTIDQGRSFRLGEREVVINQQAASQFNENVTLGANLTFTTSEGEAVNATVVGIVDRQTDQGPFGQFGGQPRMYVPTNPFYTTTVESPTTGAPQRTYPTVFVIADSPTLVEPVQERTKAYLQEESDAALLKPREFVFHARTNQELVSQIRELLNTFTAFVTGVAVISLVVGAIGIANIMLVSVTERTREIGIMKAVGAQNRDLLELFLTEAIILGLLGALLGTLAGVLGGYFATEYVGLPLVFQPEWAGVAVLVGVVVGVVAGLYPAWSAARTDPIEALRYE